MTESDAAPTPTEPGGRRIWAIAAILGVPLGLVALLILGLVHELEHVIWTTLPDSLGQGSEPAAWYVVAVPAIGGVIAAASLIRGKLPAEAHLSIRPKPIASIPWLLLAAFATLASGFVLGPEAPLLATALAITAVVSYLGGVRSESAMLVLLAAGAFTVLSTLFVSPIAALILLLEIVAASNMVPSQRLVPLLLPGMLAGSIGLVVYAGFSNWSGIDPPTVSIPNLPAYESVHGVDILWSIPVAFAVALLVEAIQHVTARIRPLVERHPILLTGVAGALIGALAVTYRAVADRPIDDILFSGQQALPEYVAITSAGTLLLVVLFKSIAYAISLGARVEGGPIFPIMALGGAIGIAASIALPGAAMVPMVAAGLASGAAALQKLPLFGITFALLLVGGATALESTLFCVIGALIGDLVATRLAPAVRESRATDSAPPTPAT